MEALEFYNYKEKIPPGRAWYSGWGTWGGGQGVCKEEEGAHAGGGEDEGGDSSLFLGVHPREGLLGE